MSSTGFGSSYRTDPHRLQRKTKGTDHTSQSLPGWIMLGKARLEMMPRDPFLFRVYNKATVYILYTETLKNINDINNTSHRIVKEQK
jgi:hypothetical protein